MTTTSPVRVRPPGVCLDQRTFACARYTSKLPGRQIDSSSIVSLGIGDSVQIDIPSALTSIETVRRGRVGAPSGRYETSMYRCALVSCRFSNSDSLRIRS